MGCIVKTGNGVVMKVLWICNMPLPGAVEAFGLKKEFGGGWLQAEAKLLMENRKVELYACFADRKSRVLKKVYDGSMTHYAIPRIIPSLFVYDSTMEQYFDRIITEVKPDFVHIHGTENTIGLAAMKSHPELTYVVSIQGVLTYIAKHECSTIPYWAKWSLSPFVFLKRNGAGVMRKRHLTGSRNELETIKRAQYILGRTSFDKTFAQNYGSQAEYVLSREHLRDSFYASSWNYYLCQKQTILFGGGVSPLKGLHSVLQAMPDILRKYPQAQLRVIGGKLPETVFMSGYGLYIKRLISKYSLEENVEFLGSLEERDVVNEMKKANVFVSASSIDNSPNMLGEAMLMGVPCVASYVGGIPDMVENGKSGILYQHDAPYMLASAVKDLFDSEEFAKRISEGAKARAEVLHGENNINQTMELYCRIFESVR